MAIYAITRDAIRALPPTTFGAEGIGERSDLQRLLCRNIEVIDPGLLVIAEELSAWEDSRRRIDLFAIDRDANLVVIELKRTPHGDHMELQALRYAAMISTLTFDQVVEAHAAWRSRAGLEGDAREAILAFLGWDTPREDDFGEKVRVVLVAADFGKELTTSVLWLNEQGLDIRCVRLKPFRHDDRLLVEAQQVIPLPEAADYQVQLRRKAEREREARAGRTVFRRFWAGLLEVARRRSTLHQNVGPSQEQWISASVQGYGFNYVVLSHDARVELYISNWDAAENRRRFDLLHAQKEAIEADFGEPLEWTPLDGKKACRIFSRVQVGGHKSPEESWPEIHAALVEAMCRLERAFLPRLPR